MNESLWLPDSELDNGLLRFTQGVRAFAHDKLLPHARAIDEQRRFRREMVDELGAAGTAS